MGGRCRGGGRKRASSKAPPGVPSREGFCGGVNPARNTCRPRPNRSATTSTNSIGFVVGNRRCLRILFCHSDPRASARGGGISVGDTSRESSSFSWLLDAYNPPPSFAFPQPSTVKIALPVTNNLYCEIQKAQTRCVRSNRELGLRGLLGSCNSLFRNILRLSLYSSRFCGQGLIPISPNSNRSNIVPKEISKKYRGRYPQALAAERLTPSSSHD
jgi:hypothetical protein